MEKPIIQVRVRDRLKDMREAKKMTQAQFALLIETYTLKISHLESGRMKLDAETAILYEIKCGPYTAAELLEFQNLEDLVVAWEDLERKHGAEYFTNGTKVAS